MLTFPIHRHLSNSQKNFCHKKFFLLLNLFTPSFRITSGSRHLWGKRFNSLNFEHNLNFWLIKVVREVGRKFVMEDVFWMNRDLKAQLCLWALPCSINLKQFWYTNSGLAWTPKSPHPLREKLCWLLHHLNDWWRCI